MDRFVSKAKKSENGKPEFWGPKGLRETSGQEKGGRGGGSERMGSTLGAGVVSEPEISGSQRGEVSGLLC